MGSSGNNDLHVFRRPDTTSAYVWVGKLATGTAPTNAGVLTLAANNVGAISITDEVAVIAQGAVMGSATCGNNDFTVTHTTGVFSTKVVAVGNSNTNQDLRGCNALAGSTTHEYKSGAASLAKWSANFDGTTERLECSRRGLCDSATGICTCFKGYTLDDCSLQSVLAS